MMASRTDRAAGASRAAGAGSCAITGLRSRAAGFFVAPAQAEAAAPTAVLPGAARVAVLGGAGEAAPLAAAVALWLRAADRAPAALVAVWRERAAGRGAAMPSATRLAARLAEADLPATARGRLAWLTLPADPGAAVAAVHRAAAVVDAPLVTALGGARPAALDALVTGHDLVVVAAEADTALARAALAALPLPRDRALACRPPSRGVPAALARAGLRAPRAVTAALAAEARR
jgi:hypothetical protein